MNKTTDTMERKMKDSGIPWIGLIPEGWEVCRVKSALKWISVKNHGNERVLSLYRDIGIVFKDERDDNHNVTSEKTDDYKFVESGDFVINKMKAWQGSMAVSKYQGIVSPAYYVAKFTNAKIFKPYFHYLLRDKSYTLEYLRLSTGLRVGQWDLQWEDFCNIRFLIPPLHEQEAIALWLDEKCGEIDELIEVEQKMIVELEAYRQALITETVTRGLNPEATMRQTGISWIPEIPEHWETITLRGLSKKFRKGSGITKEDLMENGDILCIRYGDLYTKYDFHMSNIQCRTNVDKIASPVYGEYGDILFTCSGEDIDAIGKSAALLCSEPCLIGGDLIIMKHDQYPKFLGYSISSEIAQKQKSYGKSKLKVVHTSVKDLKNVIIALPPIAEQQAIADYLDTKCNEIDELIAVKREKIETLKLYRQSIIFEAVTGKIQIE